MAIFGVLLIILLYLFISKNYRKSKDNTKKSISSNTNNNNNINRITTHSGSSTTEISYLKKFNNSENLGITDNNIPIKDISDIIIKEINTEILSDKIVTSHGKNIDQNSEKDSDPNKNNHEIDRNLEKKKDALYHDSFLTIDKSISSMSDQFIKNGISDNNYDEHESNNNNICTSSTKSNNSISSVGVRTYMLYFINVL